MSLRLYVANLEWSITDAQLEEFFKQVGPVAFAKVITDRETGRSRGFGFVEFENDDLANEAIKKLDGVAFNKRNIIVKTANPKSENKQGERW